MTTRVDIPEVRGDGLGRLGRHVEHDPRSRDYPFETAAPAPIVKVLWRRYGAVLNQGQLGSCTGNAVAGAVNTSPIRKPARTLVEKNAVKLYELATQLDGFPGVYPPDDTGSSGLAACKAAKQLGYISAYLHAFNIDQALQAVMAGPVITGVNWHDGFDHPDANGVVHPTGAVRGGHEFEILGYDPATRLLTAVNSWGSRWGVSGRFFFSLDTWATLLHEQGDVTIPLP